MTETNCPEWDYDWDAKICADKLSENVERAYRTAIDVARSKLVELDDIKAWHLIMFNEIVPVSYYAGNFRQLDTKRTCLNQQVGVPTSRYTPLHHPTVHLGEPPESVIASIESLLLRIRQAISVLEIGWSKLENDAKAFRLAALIGELVGCFIMIHPFLNGNGRTSRVLWAAALVRFGVSAQCRIHPRPEESTPYATAMEAAMVGDFRPVQLEILKHLKKSRPHLAI